MKSLLIHPEELSRKWIDRMPVLGVDTLTLHPTGGLTADRSLADLLACLDDPAYRALIDYAIDEVGLRVTYAFHAAAYLLPRELFEVHPDWFRMDREGNRTPAVNFCPSNPDALAYFAERAAELAMRLYRSAPEFDFWLDDVKDSACHCPVCRGLSTADQHLQVENAVIAAIRARIPDARLAHLAYCDALMPPTQIKPAPGIFVEFAPIERDFTRPVTDCPPAYAENLIALLDYFAPEPARVLEYWFDNSLFSHWKKPPKQFMPNNSFIREDIAWYRALGYSEIACFACFLGADYEVLYGEPDLSAYGD